MIPAAVLVVASRFNEAVTRRLEQGAVDALVAAGVPVGSVTRVWVPGAWELPIAVARGLATGRYDFAVAVGALIRGETAHFDVIASEAARGLGAAAQVHGRPVGFGLLTCETLEQALARAGGDAGNKGAEAAEAALDTWRTLERLERNAST